MSYPYKQELIPSARSLRKNATKQEKHLWYDFLAKYPLRFQRQKAISGFIVDFYCHAAKLVIEVDGSQHLTENGEAYDKERTAVLEGFGLKVIRFSNEEVDRYFDHVCRHINDAVYERLPQSATLTASSEREPEKESSF